MPELAKAYVQIIPTAEGIQGRLTELMGGEADRAGSAAGKRAGASFGSALKGVAVIGGAALSAAAAGVGALGKAAIEGFAEYEQLIGGVETLFDESAGIIEDYANRAYETAGLSANEYMSTVTSFSASLLQALGGDTAAAAEYADQAVIDMSDNANKMGTDMESIQNAYQGFAKQNFTMLDNLKLGYGGTAAEMQRLLDDASALSGVEYDMSSFADITEAIHVIQTDMGITGTTAQEASETISGSLSALGSAWSNLVTGMASDDADLDQLISNVVSSGETALGNLIPVAETALNGVATLVESIAPVIAEKLPGLIETVLPSLLSAASTLVVAVVEALPSILTVLIEQGPVIINELISSVLTMLPDIISLGFTLLTTLALGIADSLPELVPTVIDVIMQIVQTLTDPENLKNLLDAALAIIVALAGGIIDSLPELVPTIIDVVFGIVGMLTDPETLGSLLGAALSIILALGEGIIKSLPELGSAVWEIISGIGGEITDLWEDIKDIGGNVVAGIWEGISAGYEWITGKISGWIDDVLGFFKRLLGIASPSKVFAEMGGYMSEGLAVGIEGSIGDVESAMGDLSDAAVNAWDADGLTASVTAAGSYRFGGAGAERGSRTNSVTVNVYGRDGQSVRELAKEVERVITQSIRTREAAWA